MHFVGKLHDSVTRTGAMSKVLLRPANASAYVARCSAMSRRKMPIVLPPCLATLIPSRMSTPPPLKRESAEIPQPFNLCTVGRPI